MSEGIIQEINRERDDVLDVERLIEAVRGSQVARILFHYRSLDPAEANYRGQRPAGATHLAAQSNATALLDARVVDVLDAQAGIH